MLAVQAAYGLDVPSITYDVYNIEAEALGQRLLLTDAAMPDIDRSAPLIRDKDDLRADQDARLLETAGALPLSSNATPFSIGSPAYNPRSVSARRSPWPPTCAASSSC